MQGNYEPLNPQKFNVKLGIKYCFDLFFMIQWSQQTDQIAKKANENVSTASQTKNPLESALLDRHTDKSNELLLDQRWFKQSSKNVLMNQSEVCAQ